MAPALGLVLSRSPVEGVGDEAATADEGAPSGNRSSLSSGTSPPISVLLVDPCADSRRKFERAIGGYDFIQCHGVEQVGASTPLRENPDVVLIKAPVNGSAWAVFGQRVARAATLFPRSALLILDGDADHHARELALTNGISGFLSGHASADSLAAAILLASRGVAVLPRPAFEQLRRAARKGGAAVRAARRQPAQDGNDLPLTLRQKQVVQLLLEGLSNKEIAHRMGIAEGTVKVHVRSIMERAGVMSRTQLVLSVLGRSG